MRDHDILNDSEGNWTPAVHAIATLTDTEHGKRPITSQEIIYEQAKNSNCRQASATVGLPGLTSNYNRSRFLVRTAHIYGAVQKVVPVSIQTHFLYHSLHTMLVGNRGERRIYEFMRNEYDWP